MRESRSIPSSVDRALGRQIQPPEVPICSAAGSGDARPVSAVHRQHLARRRRGLRGASAADLDHCRDHAVAPSRPGRTCPHRCSLMSIPIVVSRHLEGYWPLITPGGYLIGDDYSWNSVKQAADEFAARTLRTGSDRGSRQMAGSKARGTLSDPYLRSVIALQATTATRRFTDAPLREGSPPARLPRRFAPRQSC